MYPLRKLNQETIDSLFGEIPQPPKQIWIRGNLPPDTHVMLTVVGSRKCTSYGKQVCESLITGLATYPIAIVSGLALGIDGIAHRAALKAGLPALAVPGSGLDDSAIIPRTHLDLANEILTAGGGFISEYEPKMPAAQWTFPQRNRLMAGMARATLVIEAEHKSGTRITAKLATDYNRDVLAVPGSIFSPTSEGTNELIRLGATPITCSADIIEALGMMRPASGGGAS